MESLISTVDFTVPSEVVTSVNLTVSDSDWVIAFPIEVLSVSETDSDSEILLTSLFAEALSVNEIDSVNDWVTDMPAAILSVSAIDSESETSNCLLALSVNDIDSEIVWVTSLPKLIESLNDIDSDNPTE